MSIAYTFRALVCMAAVVCAANFASATESGLYVGVGVGQSKFDLADDETQLADVGTKSTIDDTDTAWSVAAGYRFSQYVGLEVSYNDLGKARFQQGLGFVGPGVTGTIDGTASVKGTGIALVLALPINNWEFYGKLGALFARTEVQAIARLSIGTFIESDSANTTETMATLGVGYTIKDHYHIKFDWTRIPKVGDQDKTGEDDVTVVSAGFQYRF